jgi:hypothetical protein
MRTLVTATFALGVPLLAGDGCRAQFASPSNAPVVKQEPSDGRMSPGAIVLVDDGSCGKGRIKEVTGGELAAVNARPRTIRCIAKSAR